MSNNPNEVHNFEELMRKYLKNNEPMINKYDYQSPLKEIAPVEPLIFQNDILPRNNNPNNIQNYENRFNNEINNNINNNINKNNYLNNNINNINDNNKFITPSKPNNKNSSDINSFIVSSIEREKALKEEKKKKQLEYQKMLDEQIKEKKIRQKKEKEKRLKEDLLFEEKLRLENEKYEEEQKKNKNINKYRNNSNNIFSDEEKVKINNPVPPNNLIFEKNNINDNLNLEKENEENVQNEIINNGMKRAKSQPYMEVMNNNMIQQNQKYIINPQYVGIQGNESQENPLFLNPNLNQNIPQNPIPIEHLVSTSSQIPAKYLNPLNPKLPQYKTQNNYYPSNRQNPNQTQNFFQNTNNINIPLPPKADLSPYMTQRQYYDYKQKLHRVPSDLGSNTNISINHSNYPTSYQIPFNNNLMNSSPNPVNFNNNSQNVNDFLNMNNQNYFGKIMEMFFNEQKKILDSYKETIEKLKTERDEAIYKNKANEEKILALQRMQSDQEILEKNLGYFPFKNNYQQNMEKTLDSIMQKNEDFNYSNENKIPDENKKIGQSLNNINNNSNISDSKLASLITSTKFVKVNPNGDNKELLETWKKDDKEDNIKINNGNNFDKDIANNKNRLSGMDTNAFIEKKNLINNKILEPPDEPQNYLNDNNISIISKTQKNDDKSFANELSNRNDKEENDNINNDESIKYNNNNYSKEINKSNNFKINSDIRDSDLSAQKFVVELQSKDFILNNVHNPIMQNLDNNISYSTQIKERLEEKRKQLEKNNKKDIIDIISEKESTLSNNLDDDKKNKYQNYAFKQVNCSKNEAYNDLNENNDIKINNINPGLKNIDNNLTVSSKKNYSILFSKHLNNNEKEKNPFENIVSINDIEDNLNDNIKNKKIYIENKNQEIEEEEINDIPNLDSPRNENNVTEQFNSNINKDENINNERNNARSKNNDEIIDKLNFFEDDNIISSKVKIDKNESKNKKYNNIDIDINNSFLKDNANLINNKINNIDNINNNLNDISKYSNQPPNDITKEKITSLNDLYDQYVKKKKNQLNETNNSIINNNNNNIENNSLLNESLNTFTQNLNIKWKDLTKKDIHNINREHHYNNDNNYENNYSYLEEDKLEDEKIFDKVNQFTRVALNELKQSQLSVFSKDKTIKKYE